MSEKIKPDYDKYSKYLKESIIVAEKQLESFDLFIEIAEKVKELVSSGGTVFFCGNGGSAADSQHLAAELIGRFKKDRNPIKSIALTTDTSVITSNANDIGYDKIFERQVEALCEKGDVLIGLSTSGESISVLKAIEAANKNNVFTIGFTKSGDNTLSKIAQLSIQVPTEETGIIQQSHITFGQLLCYFLEEELH
tara:strand:+ start:176 stop:760 length:585 start_codon:yes stop_codon:yes gene_type:complete